jgi:hypothetical protein
MRLQKQKLEGIFSGKAAQKSFLDRVGQVCGIISDKQIDTGGNLPLCGLDFGLRV